MIKITKAILSSLLLSVTLGAVETTLTNISFIQDDNGNLNPNIFIPVYYGSDNQFYSAVGYTSGTFSETKSFDEVGYTDAKSSLISTKATLTLNYITYILPLTYTTLSFGINSKFSNIQNNQFSHGFSATDNEYLAIDNENKIDVQNHNIEIQALVPLGKYMNSRITANISPYTSVKVENNVELKYSAGRIPLSKTSTTIQDVSYSGLLELQTNIDFYVNFGLVAGYSNEPLKYNIVGEASKDLVDTTEITTKYLVKVIFDQELLGGINPSIGYGVEYAERKDNLGGPSVSLDKTIFTLGVEKRF